MMYLTVRIFSFALTAGLMFGPFAAHSQSFRDYPAIELAAGQPVQPSFESRDAWARNFRTRITDGVSQGANYAGSYTVIEIGCGSSCRFAYLVDVRNGQVFRFPYGGEEQHGLDLQFFLDSRMMRVRWQDGDECITQALVWDGASFSVVAQDISLPTGYYCDLLGNN